MKFPKVIAYPAPKSLVNWASKAGQVLAAVMVIMIVLQLIGIVDTMNNMANQLETKSATATIAMTVIILACEIFSLPFLLRRKISHLARFLSGLFAVITPWIWLLISIWSIGGSAHSAQFGVVSGISIGWWLAVANLIWLFVSMYIVKQIGIEKTWQAIVVMVKNGETSEPEETKLKTRKK